MKTRHWAVLAMICAVGLTLALGEGALTVESREGYVCPPCGCDLDDHVSDKPGVCRVCNMTLVKKGSSAAAPASHSMHDRRRVAILIFDGVQIIDYSGPFEVFGQAGFEVVTVATSSSPITTTMDMRVTPTYTLEDAPEADVLVIPGGDVSEMQKSQRVVKWIQERSKRAEHTLSVCNGAYILAATGLLDGLTATTYYDLIDGLSAVAPGTKVVRDQRYVDNGKVITTAGLSSGIDGALRVVERLLGKGRAQMVALNMEYDWKPDSNYARASLADRHLRSIFGKTLRLPVPHGAQATVSNTEGTIRSWEVQWQVEGDATVADVMRRLNKTLIDSHWLEKAASPDATRRSWQFADGAIQWNGSSDVVSASPRLVTVRLEIERVASAQ